MIGHCLDPNAAHGQTAAHTAPVARDPETDALLDACLRKALNDVRKHNPEASDEELVRRAVWLHRQRMAVAQANALHERRVEAEFLYIERMADRIAEQWLARMDLHDVEHQSIEAFEERVEKLAARARDAARVLAIEGTKAVDHFRNDH